MKNILFYISGHGYGHSTRMIEVIKKLTTDNNNDVFCHVKTNAPQWLFQLNLSKKYQYHYLVTDVGVVQNDSFNVNKERTLKRYQEFLQGRTELVPKEAEFVHQHNIKLIIADIPFMAFDVAEVAGVPGIAVGNFSWDWICEPYVSEFPQYSQVVEEIRNSYRKANLLLRLPFSGGMSVFPKIEEVPLIARTARLERTKVLAKLGLKANERRKIILVALRTSDLQRIHLNRLKEMSDYLFITFHLSGTKNNLLQIPENFIPFPELVAISSAVVSKLGYGIVSECIANRTPLLYTPREDFSEENVLSESLQKYGVSQFVSRDEFFDGNWQNYLEKLFATDDIWNPIAINGAEMVANKIRAML